MVRLDWWQWVHGGLGGFWLIWVGSWLFWVLIMAMLCGFALICFGVGLWRVCGGFYLFIIYSKYLRFEARVGSIVRIGVVILLSRSFSLICTP